jgi:hypothetical protein
MRFGFIASRFSGPEMPKAAGFPSAAFTGWFDPCSC